MVLSPQNLPNGSSKSPALIPSLSPEAPTVRAIQPEEYFKHKGYDPETVNISMTQQVESREAMLFRHKREEIELLARIEKEKEEQSHQRLKEYLGYSVGIVLISVLVSISIAFMCNKNASPDAQGWARTTLTSVITAIGGYVFGSKNKAGS
jgi:cation transport ATPase